MIWVVSNTQGTEPWLNFWRRSYFFCSYFTFKLHESVIEADWYVPLGQFVQLNESGKELAARDLPWTSSA
jgi:hypothetical protein